MKSEEPSQSNLVCALGHVWFEFYERNWNFSFQEILSWHFRILPVAKRQCLVKMGTLISSY
ncbi:hypothetical protein LguiB_021616 [Lonicera macranthoides]